MLAYRRGKIGAAARILGCAELYFAGHASRHRDPVERMVRDELLLRMRESLPPQELAARMREGEALGFDEALELALED